MLSVPPVAVRPCHLAQYTPAKSRQLSRAYSQLGNRKAAAGISPLVLFKPCLSNDRRVRIAACFLSQMQEKCIYKLYMQSWEGLKGILANASAQTDSRPSSLRTKNCHVVTLLSSCQQEPPWQRQEGVSGGSPIESGKKRCMWSKRVCLPLVNSVLKAASLICLGMQTTKRQSQNCHRKTRKASAPQSSLASSL